MFEPKVDLFTVRIGHRDNSHLVGVTDLIDFVPCSPERLAILKSTLRGDYRHARHLGLPPTAARQFAVGAIAAWHSTVVVHRV